MVKIMENPIKMDDLGVPLFLEASHMENTEFLSNSPVKTKHTQIERFDGTSGREMGPRFPRRNNCKLLLIEEILNPGESTIIYSQIIIFHQPRFT